jgi:hypothetical protein
MPQITYAECMVHDAKSKINMQLKTTLHIGTWRLDCARHAPVTRLTGLMDIRAIFFSDLVNRKTYTGTDSRTH